MKNVIMCGPNGRVTASSISQAERKTIINYGLFLQGKGDRCPYCLHKPKKHWLGEAGNTCCGDKDECDCTVSRDWVKRWWVRRKGEADGNS